MNMRSAIQRSCDVYFYEVARRLGVDRLKLTAEKFGLGNQVLNGVFKIKEITIINSVDTTSFNPTVETNNNGVDTTSFNPKDTVINPTNFEYSNEEGFNPEAIVQDAEEFEMSAEEKINIDEDKMEKYILKILGSEIFA